LLLRKLMSFLAQRQLVCNTILAIERIKSAMLD